MRRPRSRRAAYEMAAGSLTTALGTCASGRELVGNGSPADVEIAGEVNARDALPVLVDGWFVHQ